MRQLILSLAFTLLSWNVYAQKLTVIKSPAALPAEDERLKIFLGGSIDMGNAEAGRPELPGNYLKRIIYYSIQGGMTGIKTGNL